MAGNGTTYEGGGYGQQKKNVKGVNKWVLVSEQGYGSQKEPANEKVGVNISEP